MIICCFLMFFVVEMRHIKCDIEYVLICVCIEYAKNYHFDVL